LLEKDMSRKLIALFTLFFLALYSAPAQSISAPELNGKWRLLYRGDYGYQFEFYRNYKALCIVFLHNKAVIFKGVYTLEDNDTIRINVSEMKTQDSISWLNVYSGFNKTAATYFTFRAHREAPKNRDVLQLTPLKIIIDGNTSEGYFEPLIKLNKI
jgi:hypothetical protein